MELQDAVRRSKDVRATMSIQSATNASENVLYENAQYISINIAGGGLKLYIPMCRH